MGNKNLTIMFTDMKGFTQRTSEQSRTKTVEMIRKHKDLLLPVIESRGGTFIKSIGDSFLITYESPTDAVLTGISLQKTLHDYNAGVADSDKIEIRIAINTGEVSTEEGDVYGEAVNIAARIEGIAEANEVYFTEATFLAMNKSEVPSAEIGAKVLKGIPHKIKIYRVLREGESAAPGSAPSQQPAAPAGKKQYDLRDLSRDRTIITYDPLTGVASFHAAPIEKRFAALLIDVVLILLLFIPSMKKQGLKSNFSRVFQITKELKKEGRDPKWYVKNMPADDPRRIEMESLNRDLTVALKKVGKVVRLSLILFVLYVSISLGVTGRTLGKFIFGIRVLQSNGNPVSVPRAFVRTVLYFLSSTPFLLGFIWAIFDGKRQAWHDKIADTIVIPAR